MEDPEAVLSKIEIVDLYEDIASITFSQSDLINICLNIPCVVDLSIGNIVYAVEKKFKNKLEKCDGNKKLKWLQRNLKKIVPNPEAKYLKWKKERDLKSLSMWTNRKLDVLDYLEGQTERVYSQQYSLSLCSVSTPAYSSLGNTSRVSLQTVIESTRKSTQDPEEPLLQRFEQISRSTMESSNEEFHPCMESEINAIQEQEQNKEGNSANQEKRIQPLLPEWNFISEDAYVTFYQDMQVTSTQEFG